MSNWRSGITIVLGADGFVGRHLVRRCAEAGWPVYAIGKSGGDFTAWEAVRNAFAAAPRATRIVHAITKQRTGAIQNRIQAELLNDNARIHLNVLEAWRAFQPQAKLISLGSSCTYPESALPTTEEEFGIGRPHPSVEGYALAKKVLATGCSTYGTQYGLRWLHCVLATLYGPGAHIEDGRAHFMAAMIARALREHRARASEFTVWGDPQTVRDLLHVDDQIDAIIAADERFANRVLNVTANAPVTIGECAKAILESLDWNARIVYPQGSFQGANYKSLNSKAFLKATGWRPRLSLSQGIADTLRHTRAENGAQ